MRENSSELDACLVIPSQSHIVLISYRPKSSRFALELPGSQMMASRFRKIMLLLMHAADLVGLPPCATIIMKTDFYQVQQDISRSHRRIDSMRSCIATTTIDPPDVYARYKNRVSATMAGISDPDHEAHSPRTRTAIFAPNWNAQRCCGKDLHDWIRYCCRHAEHTTKHDCRQYVRWSTGCRIREPALPLRRRYVKAIESLPAIERTTPS